MAKFLSWALFIVFAGAQLLLVAPDILSQTGEDLKVAVVGPMSGPEEASGRAMVAGAQLLVDQVNAGLGKEQRHIELVVRDDKNDPKTAVAVAKALAGGGDVLAVLGHLSDATSAAAAPIYAKSGLPVVTGASGLPKVTKANNWSFRVGLTTTHQGTFLANYIGRVMKAEEIYIVTAKGEYGTSLAVAVEDELNFQRRLSAFGVKVIKKWTLDPADPSLEQSIETLAKELAGSYAGAPVVLAVPGQISAAVIKGIQSNPRTRFGKTIPYNLIGPDTLGQASLLKTLSEMQAGRFGKRNLTEGLRVVAPFLEDVANQQARDFRRAYLSRHEQPASIIASGFRDAAAVLAHALGQLAASPDDLSAARHEVRDRLAAINTPAKSIIGVTGALYFNRDGDAIKTVPIGVYRDQRLVSPPAQLSPVLSPIAQKGQAIYQIAGGYFTPTRIVATGVQLNKIRDIDFAARTAHLDFNIWFRHQGQLDLAAIEFPNAVKPVALGKPVEEREKNGSFYRLYQVAGTFATDYLGPVGAFDHRMIGFQLRHGELNRERLILVPDLVGMDMGHTASLTERVGRITSFGDESSHRVDQVGIFLDAEPVALMGNPEFVGKKIEGYSRINLGVWVAPTEVSFRSIIDPEVALRLFLIFGLIGGLIGIASDRYRASPRQKWFWFPTLFVAVALLVTSEPALIGLFITHLDSPYMAGAVPTTVKLLWWFTPAWLLSRFIEQFIWAPLELRTKRAIPHVVRFFTSGTFYTLAGLGVMAFVFGQKVTSLLATSGVLAMIIGLAIQMNISNIFSGIAINVERPFRIGDWIRVTDNEPGRVVSITWRTTRLETIDRNIICIPNAMASDTTLENLSYPTEEFRSQLLVHVDPGAKPEWVEKILLDAVMSAPGVLPSPIPLVQFDGVKEWSAQYAARFFCPNYEASIALEAAVWRDIIRNLRYAGFESVIHEEFTLFHLGDAAKKSGDLAPMLIEDVEVFQPFGNAERMELCKSMARHRLEPDRTIIEQGDAGDSLFIVAEGALKVEITVDDGETLEVSRLGPGDFFGEMALLTGESRGATITTLTPSQVFEIAKKDIEPIIQAYPDITNDLSEILTRRELENLRRKNEHFASLDEEKSLASLILGKITNFFGGGGATRSQPAPEPPPQAKKTQAEPELATAAVAVVAAPTPSAPESLEPMAPMAPPAQFEPAPTEAQSEPAPTEAPAEPRLDEQLVGPASRFQVG